MLRFKGSHLIVPLCVAANAGWWITQGFGVKLHDFLEKEVYLICSYKFIQAGIVRMELSR